MSRKETWPFHSWGSGHSLQHLKDDTQVNGINFCDECDSWDGDRELSDKSVVERRE
jgi:hypothetical protein